MAATTLLPASPRLPHRGIIHRRYMLTTRRVSINAQGGENDGKSVIDENMVVLRMRIKKVRVLESTKNTDKRVAPPASADEGGPAPPSADWKEWERKVFTRYHEGVCDSMEMLQAYLMNTRPSVALGILALVAMSVPLSSSVVMGNALKVARGLLAGCHVCIDIDF